MGNARFAQKAQTEGKPVGMTRRQLCLGASGAAAILALGGVKYLPSSPLVRPPGGQDETKLAALCIRCQKCYEACPRNVIAPSHIEDGIMQLRTPALTFADNWCDFCAEENEGQPLCAHACPTGAIAPPDETRQESVILGKAVINTQWCLAYKLIGCKFCYDTCPYQAMKLDEQGRPVVITDLCNGCGACESVCVSLSAGSISEGATSRAIVVAPIEE